MERSGERFRLTRPLEDDADETRVSNLLSSLTGLEIEDFLDDPETVFEPGPTTVRLNLDEPEADMLLEIAQSAKAAEAAEGATRMRADGQVFTATTDLASLLALDPSDWQSTSWLDRDAFETDVFRVVSSGKERVYERRDGMWWRGDVEIEFSTVSSFLRSLSAASGTPVEDVSALDEVPDHEIELQSPTGDETLWLHSGAEGNFARRSGRATPLRLDSESVEDFIAKLEALESFNEDVASPAPE